MRANLLSALIEADGMTLRGKPDGERYGPCPKCSGRDRFHVCWYAGRERFFCRQCHPRRGDAIEYLHWAHGMTYREACAVLGLPTSQPAGQATRQPVTARGVVIPRLYPIQRRSG